MEPFKNLIDQGAIHRIAAFVGGDWDREAFERHAAAGLHELELKARVKHVAACLRDQLDPDWLTALSQVTAALPRERTATDGLTEGFALWPVLTMIEDHGGAHPDASLAVLEQLTCFSTAEFAVRPFFRDDPDAMVRWVERWSVHPNVHVRRLASEGSRPRLPWGIRLQARIDTPQALFPALERLRDDPDEYVRRSVANHLNDIAKDHPDLVLALCARWWSPDRQRLVKHALRTLVKAGDARAYQILGLPAFTGSMELAICPDTLVLGEALNLRLTLCATTEQRVRIDVGLHHRLANGGHSVKVFHWTERTLTAGEPQTLDKAMVLKAVTTRRYHPGLQHVDVRVNGTPSELLGFTLDLP